MDERKNFSKLNKKERERLIEAIKWMKVNDRNGDVASPVNPSTPEINVYQKYVNFHSSGGFTKNLRDFTLNITGSKDDMLHSIIIDGEEWIIPPPKKKLTKIGIDAFFNQIPLSGGIRHSMKLLQDGSLDSIPDYNIIQATISPAVLGIINVHITWRDSPFDDIKLKVIKSGSTTPTEMIFTSQLVSPSKTYNLQTFQVAHRNPIFLPWHRVFVRLFELDLQFADKNRGNDGKLTLPYWDWVNETDWNESRKNSVWHKDNFGGFSKDDTGIVTGKHFSKGKWKLYAPLLASNEDHLIRRANNQILKLPTKEMAKKVKELNHFRTSNPGKGIGAGNRRYAGRLEHELHDVVHSVVGGRWGPLAGNRIGHMADALISPQDPVFFLFHCNVDRLWAEWQKSPMVDNKILASPFDNIPVPFTTLLKLQYPKFGLLPGRRLTDNIEPWAILGPPSVYKFNVRAKDILNSWNFDSSVHNFLGKGYKYDTELTSKLP